jgi:hypothetical protein
MNEQPPVPTANNTFERIKRVNERSGEFWSARELAKVLEYSDFRNFITVIKKAREACAKSGHTVADHFGDFNEMVNIGSGAQREFEDWALFRGKCRPLGRLSVLTLSTLATKAFRHVIWKAGPTAQLQPLCVFEQNGWSH